MASKIWEKNEDMMAFHDIEEQLVNEHHGEVAVFCEGKLIAIGKTIKEAIAQAKKKTKKRTFFVQELYTAEEQSSCIL